MTDESENNAEWAACPAGQLRAMVDGITVRDKRRASGTFAGVASVLVLVIAVGTFAFWGRQPLGGSHVAEMTCAECSEHFEAYHAHLVRGETSLAGDVIHRMEHHLELCRGCHDHFNELYPGVLAQLRAISPQAVTLAGSTRSPVLLASHLLTVAAL